MGQDRSEARWMGLDVGAKVVGIALSDPLRLTARPLMTLRRRSPAVDAERIVALTVEHTVSRIVVGRPLHLTGEASATLTLVDTLVEALRAETALPIEWADERLSSKEAEALMAQRGVPVAQRRRLRDEWAAALILQWYLEEHAIGL